MNSLIYIVQSQVPLKLTWFYEGKRIGNKRSQLCWRIDAGFCTWKNSKEIDYNGRDDQAQKEKPSDRTQTDFVKQYVPLEILGVAALGISSMRLVVVSGSILQKSRENKGAVESITK